MYSEMAICFQFSLFSLIPLFISGALLPAPQNITIISTNMKHFLIWSPVVVPGEAVKYSVEFQGEYERDYANDSWIPIGECTSIHITQCDITEDISATVPYDLRIRAALGTQASRWATLNGFFSRVTTSLFPPMMTVTADGYHLLVELEYLGPAFEFWIFYWRKGQEREMNRKVVRDSSTAIHLGTMEAEADYCVKAQTYVEVINRNSNFSEVQCVRAGELDSMQGLCVPHNINNINNNINKMPVSVYGWSIIGDHHMEAYCYPNIIQMKWKHQDGKRIWVTFAPLFLILFIVSALFLIWVTWKICQICQYSCCPNEDMPDTLKLTESPARMLNYKGEEIEKCDESVQVLPPEEFLLLFDL